MSKPWMLKVAGILDIVIGGLAVVFALVLLVGGIMTLNRPGGGTIFIMIAIIFAILGVPAIMGGTCALRKKRRQMAIIGSLFIAPLWGIGVVTALLIVLSKVEFELAHRSTVRSEQM